MDLTLFCFLPQTRKEASWLQRQMTRDGHKVALLSGELEVKQREEVINRFRHADFRVLITTNLCSRGLDVPQVGAMPLKPRPSLGPWHYCH